ncbi:MAG: PaaI family thioesterase [Veillonella sp.]|nr:PaaI family thioesterase [Veillonella sp.]
MATTLLEYFNELRNQNPFSWVKDSEITAVEPGHAEMTLQTNDTEYCNFRGDLHGAVCIGLADSVMGTACFTLGKSVSTIDLNGNYVKAVKGGTVLRGVANVEHNGKTTMVKSLPELPWRFIEEDNPDLV